VRILDVVVFLLVFSLLIYKLADGIAPLFAQIWNSRRPPGPGPISDLVGRRANVISVEGSTLRVELNGVGWAATANEPVTIGAEVLVEKIDGLTLHVIPVK